MIDKKKPHNRYINDGVRYHNNIQNRLLLEKVLQRESQTVAASSIEVLREFECIDDELQTIWNLACRFPQIGTESGKVRLVLVIQTDLLNQIPHLSTLVCPLTTNIAHGINVLRISLRKGTANLHHDCDIMIDQMRAIDNNRLIRKIGNLPQYLVERVKENIIIILDIYH